MFSSRWAVLLLPTLVAGCATSGTLARHSTRDAQLITEDEIVASHAQTAYEAIRKLRGNFLSNRGPTSFYNTSSAMPTVYLDEQRYGNVDILRTIPADIIATIRLFRAWEATTAYGAGNMGGVIAITTRQGGGEDAAWRARARH